MCVLRRYDMNGRSQMQGGKNWFLPKEMNANRFFCDSHWLEIWSNHFCPSIGPNGGSVAMDSEAPSLFDRAHRRQHSRHRHVRPHQLTQPEPVAPRRSVLAPGQRSSVPAHLPATTEQLIRYTIGLKNSCFIIPLNCRTSKTAAKCHSVSMSYYPEGH